VLAEKDMVLAVAVVVLGIHLVAILVVLLAGQGPLA